MEKVILAWSGGKDSALSLYEIQRSGQYEIASLLTTINAHHDRVSMHGVRRALVEAQASSLGLPLAKVLLPGDCSNQEYEAQMRQVLGGFKQDGITRVVYGDIFLEWIKDYRENKLSQVGMGGIFPIWGRDTTELTRSFVELGFRAVITCVDARLLDRRFLGRTFDRRFLAELPPGVDPGGENGEFHSFVFDGPIFQERISYKLGRVVQRDSFYFRDVIPQKAVMTEYAGKRGE